MLQSGKTSQNLRPPLTPPSGMVSHFIPVFSFESFPKFLGNTMGSMRKVCMYMDAKQTMECHKALFIAASEDTSTC